MSMSEFIRRMQEMNLTNMIFLDNTATEAVSQYYAEILDSSISISTPNKIATSSTHLEYKRLKQIAEKRGVLFFYETNVGAGLPILSTLSDLINSGDRIQKIEGVLSGSLSFIFNSFQKGKKFSEIVKLAKEKGYTEPDPRIDLGGLDVRRKLVILARESNYPMEAEMISLPSFLPEDIVQAKDVETFFSLLENADAHFDRLLEEADRKNEKLRIVAKLDNGVGAIELVSVDVDHPFYSLSGSDNMIVFTTDRYKERPLVIRGPGAGADVTAAGVFAEIIRIANYLT